MEQEKEYQFFPELTDDGKQQAQDLMIKFEKTLKESATKIISEFSTDFYCDVLNEIESDHWVNYRTKIVNAICNYSNKKSGSYDFDRIRKAIYMHNKEEIIKDLNQDLLEEISNLKKEITRIYKSRF
ncbi:MAG: hypothetical protein PF487_05480 [Bacteroidales bacterium]|jgi:nitrogenase subunit NifH|nr:hypothetical protein [Bacteroidales bacterium]